MYIPPNVPCWHTVVVYNPTLTKTPKKSSVLSSWTLLDTVFLSLQCDACFWTSAVDRLKWGPHSACKGTQRYWVWGEILKSNSKIAVTQYDVTQTGAKARAEAWHIKGYFVLFCISLPDHLPDQTTAPSGRKLCHLCKCVCVCVCLSSEETIRT